MAAKSTSENSTATENPTAADASPCAAPEAGDVAALPPGVVIENGRIRTPPLTAFDELLGEAPGTLIAVVVRGVTRDGRTVERVLS